jgi:DNA ligase (NAD+)
MCSNDARREISALSELLRKYNHEYHVLNLPTVSDLEYDKLFDRLKELEASFPALIEPDSPGKRVGSDLTSDLPDAPHTIPVLSLDKAYTSDEIDAWISKTIKAAGRDLTFTIEEKIDGVSIVLYYEDGLLARAITRGNGFVGNDVTANVMTIRSVPLRLRRDVTLAVRGEIYLPVAQFYELNSKMETPYANPRNLAAGSLRRIRSSEVADVPLDIFVYEGFVEGITDHVEMMGYLRELGFRTNPNAGFFSADGTPPGKLAAGMSTWCFDDITAYLTESSDRRAALAYEIDGLVLKVNEIEVREALGYTGHHPRWAIAYKFDAPEGVTTVVSIDVQVGRTGRVTPVARVEPVRIGGSTVSNVTLHNQDYVDLLELCLGDTVAVSKRGDVIPAIERVIEKNEVGNKTWGIPDHCPSCNSVLSKRGAHHFCTNSGCPDQTKGRLFFFAGKGQMNITNLGPETLETLISYGSITRPEDIYTFDFEKLIDLPGFGEKKVALIRAGIEESRGRPFHIVLSSLGLPELGPKAAELLVSAGYGDIDLLFEIADSNDVERLTAIEGFGEKTASYIISSLKDRDVKKMINALRSEGLSFSESAPPGDTADKPMSGQVWCVTGSFENYKPRNLAMDKVRSFGGKVVAAVSGSTTHLLAGTGGGSKLRKAQELGIIVVNEEEFLDLTGKKV